MAVKYHISPVTGKPERCTATKRPCKYGAGTKHYESKAAANEAVEKMNESKAGNHRLVKNQSGSGNSPVVFNADSVKSVVNKLSRYGDNEDIPEEDASELYDAAYEIGGIMKAYDAGDKSEAAQAVTLSRLIAYRDSYNSRYNDAPDVVKAEVTETLDDALPDRLKGDVFNAINKNSTVTWGYRKADSPAFEGARDALYDMKGKIYSDDGASDPSYRSRLQNIYDYTEKVASLSCKGKKDDDAVLTARLTELRDNCINSYDVDEQSPAYIDAVGSINKALPLELRKNIDD